MVLVDESCVKAARLSDLLLNHVVIAETFNLKVVLYALINCHNRLAKFLVGLTCQTVDSCIQIKLVEDKELVFLGPAFVNSKEKVFCHAAVVGDFVRLAILRLFFTLRLLQLVFIINDTYFAKHQRPRKRREIMQNNLVEVVQVAILRPTHLRVGEVLSQILDEGECLRGAFDEQVPVHDGDQAGQDHGGR